MRGAALVLVVVLVLAAGSLLLAAVVASRPLYDEVLDRATLERLEVADPERALTFARRRTGEGHQLLLVTGHRDGYFDALDAGARFPPARDGAELLATQGYDALLETLRATGPRLRVPESELDMPVALPGDRHVAAGTNFAAHGAEAGIDEPFVFPKRVVPTPWNAPVPKGDARRLDYEVEICFVPLADVAEPGGRPALGLLLCNDFTDRWALVLGMAGGDGEIGAPGFLPVGPLLVVPRDLESFYPEIELSLWVDGRLRQRSRAGAMIWGPWTIIDQAFARADWEFFFEGQGTELLPEGRLTRESLVLSGTPAGVIFRIANVWWAAPYLDVGDEVVASATYLGRLHNTITR
jgi:2,4-diketo-3-deoxy-L-fuconate hydrolase